MGRRRAPAESEGRISDRRTPDAKIRKSYFLLRHTQEIVARDFQAAKRHHGDGPTPPGPAVGKRELDSRCRKRLPIVGFCILYSIRLSTIFLTTCPARPSFEWFQRCSGRSCGNPGGARNR